MFTHSISRAATRLPSVRTSIAALIAGAAFVLPGAARADTTCSHDSDCSKGFTCQVSGVSACPPIAPCPSGQACATPVDCTTSPVHTCQLAPCATDADCAPDMVCHADSYQECSSPGEACVKGPALADGGVSQVACPPPTPPTCTTVTEPSSCLPKYELPCKVNADCGDHFTCVPDTSTTCWASASGGGASGTGVGSNSGASSSGNSAGTTVASPPVATSPPAEPVDAGVITSPPLEPVDGGSAPTSGCTTTTLTTSSCVADSIVCTADSDCPATWTCEGFAISNGSNIACAQPALIVDGSPVTVPCEFDGGAAPPTPKTCQPPYGYATPGATSGAAGGFPLSASADAGVTATSGGGAGTNASGSGGNSSGSGATPATPPAATTENGSASASAGNTMDGGGGCQMGASPAGGAGGSLWTLVGLVGLAFRRRPRATR